MTDDDSASIPDGRRCERCGGESLTRRSEGVPVVECEACGNVVGLAEPTDTAAAVETDAVTAVDGDLDQLVTFLRSTGSPGADPRIETGRLVLETTNTTLEVTAEDGQVAIREVTTDEGLE